MMLIVHTRQGSSRQTWLRRVVALARDRRGITSVMFGISALALLGTVGLATEAGLWYTDYATAQTAADAASTAGAVGIASGESATQIKASATYILQQNGYVNGQGATYVTVNVPPASGPNKGNGNAVEVLLSRQESMNVAGLFLSQAPTLKVRSVAMYEASSPTCVLALGQDLSSSNNGEIYMSGGASLNASGCTIGANSTSADAIYLKPSPTVSAYTMVSSGGISSSCGQGPTGCGNQLNLTKPYSQEHVATADPLASVQNVPLPDASNFTSSNCTSISYPQWNSSFQVQSGTAYCGVNMVSDNSLTFPSSGGTYTFTQSVNIGVSSGNPFVNVASGTASPVTVYINGNFAIANNASVDIPPGTYFINNGNLTVGNSATLTCSNCVAGGAGVTFVLMGDSPGYVDISGSSPVTFNAPANNNYNSGFDGVAIYEVPSDQSTNQLSGSGTLALQGAVYTPGADLNISGGAGTSSATCILLDANSITMTGSGYATSSQCANYGYSWAQGPTPNGVTIVE